MPHTKAVLYKRNSIKFVLHKKPIKLSLKHSTELFSFDEHFKLTFSINPYIY